MYDELQLLISKNTAIGIGIGVAFDTGLALFGAGAALAGNESHDETGYRLDPPLSPDAPRIF